MGIKQTLMNCIPPAYYENGVEAKCMVFRICNMFDIDSQSFKEVHKKDNMQKKEKEDDSFGISKPVWGPEFNTRTGKLVES